MDDGVRFVTRLGYLIFQSVESYATPLPLATKLLPRIKVLPAPVQVTKFLNFVTLRNNKKL